MEYDSRSGLIALLHRLGLEYRKPEVIPRHLDEDKQRAFIKLYENLMNSLSPDEVVVFMAAVRAQRRRSRGSSGKSGRVGRVCAFRCAATPASAARS